jgi:hypothetical protein
LGFGFWKVKTKMNLDFSVSGFLYVWLGNFILIFAANLCFVYGYEKYIQTLFSQLHVFQYFAIFKSRRLFAYFECGDPDRPYFYDSITLRMDKIG